MTTMRNVAASKPKIAKQWTDGGCTKKHGFGWYTRLWNRFPLVGLRYIFSTRRAEYSDGHIECYGGDVLIQKTRQPRERIPSGD